MVKMSFGSDLRSLNEKTLKIVNYAPQLSFLFINMPPTTLHSKGEGYHSGGIRGGGKFRALRAHFRGLLKNPPASPENLLDPPLHAS